LISDGSIATRLAKEEQARNKCAIMSTKMEFSPMDRKSR